MPQEGRPRIDRLTTGVPGLDGILGGGLPTGTLTILTGGPGTGKSTLALQIAFQQGRLGNQSVFFITILEPAVKFLRFAQQFDFFDADLVGRTVSLVDLSTPALHHGAEQAFDVIRQHVDEDQPVLLVVDSFKALRDRVDREATPSVLYNLVVDLGVSQVTTLLIGEYDDHGLTYYPECYAADGIVQLSTVADGLRQARRLEVRKLRGSAYQSGTHFFEITPAGIVVYPRISVPLEHTAPPSLGGVARLSTGVPGLDEMLGGGIPARSVTLVEGGTGTGKTLLSLAFLVEGARRGEPGLLFAMEETREQLVEMGLSRGWDLEQLERQGLLHIVYMSPIDLAGDVLLRQVAEKVGRVGAKRAVVDSLTALQMSPASEGRSRELVYALGKTFRTLGVTGVLTNEVPELVGTAAMTGRGPSSVADNVIMLRYVEIESRLAKAIVVLKVRGSGHQHVLREMEITGDAIRVLGPFTQYRGVLTGVPTRVAGGTGPSRGGEESAPEG